MRVAKKADSGVFECDLTPMIDMTFQLIAFFMVLINFSQTESHQKIQLPSSELAKPVDEPPENAIVLHLGADGIVYMSGAEASIDKLKPYLVRERDVFENEGTPAKNVTVIIRGHKEAPTGKVQELIRVCQENNFEKFALRAKERLQ